MIKRKRTTAEKNYIIIPDYSSVKDDSWSDDANFVQIPKATVQSVKGKVVVMLYSVRFVLLRNEVTEPLLAETLFFATPHHTTQHTAPQHMTPHDITTCYGT